MTNEGMNIDKDQLDLAYGEIKAGIAQITGELNLDPNSRSATTKGMFRVAKRNFFPKILSQIAKGENVDANVAIDIAVRDELQLNKK